MGTETAELIYHKKNYVVLFMNTMAIAMMYVLVKLNIVEEEIVFFLTDP